MIRLAISKGRILEQAVKILEKVNIQLQVDPLNSRRLIIPTNIDKQGRFLIPEELKNYANIKSEAAFFGQGHFFQIWEPKSGIINSEISRKRLLKEKKSLTSILTQNK